MMTETKADVLKRLKSISGHVIGITRMVEADAYCIDVIKQIEAVEKALARVSAIVLDGHLRTCLTTAVRGEDPAERERVLGEISGVFEMMSKS